MLLKTSRFHATRNSHTHMFRNTFVGVYIDAYKRTFDFGNSYRDIAQRKWELQVCEHIASSGAPK